VRQPQHRNQLPLLREAGNSPLPRPQFPRRCVHASACGPCTRAPRRGLREAEKHGRTSSPLRRARGPARCAPARTKAERFSRGSRFARLQSAVRAGQFQRDHAGPRHLHRAHRTKHGDYHSRKLKPHASEKDYERAIPSAVQVAAPKIFFAIMVNPNIFPTDRCVTRVRSKEPRPRINTCQFLNAANGWYLRNCYEEGLKPIRPQSQPSASAVSRNVELCVYITMPNVLQRRQSRPAPQPNQANSREQQKIKIERPTPRPELLPPGPLGHSHSWLCSWGGSLTRNLWDSPAFHSH
jgi:hypothetical protein